MTNTQDPLEESEDSSTQEAGTSLDAQMWHHLPALIDSVKNGWQQYVDDPRHEHIDAMRGDVELLIYWLARRVARSNRVNFHEGDARRVMRAGLFGGHSCTDLQHQLYDNVRGGKSVTQLVQGAQDDFVNYLTTILARRKTSLYRRHRTGEKYVTSAENLLQSDSQEERLDSAEDRLVASDQANISAQQCAEGLQSLEQFAAFLQAERLKPQLERVAWSLWIAAPLSDKSRGDVSDNTHNTDRALAGEIGVSLATFERYKPMARMLIKRFRAQTGN